MRACVFVCLLAAAGCSPAGPKMHPVSGRVVLDGGDVSHLAGANVEAMLESDNTVRATGVIQSDGSFTLETLHAGVVRKGAMEGKYQARILLGDDDDDRATKKLRRAALNARYKQFKTADLSFTVPPESEVVLKLAVK